MTATKRPVKARAKSAVTRDSVEDCPLTAIHDIADYVSAAMVRYGTETNENRAIPSLQDGLKPVQRKLLFSGLTVCPRREGKTARLVGDVLGRFHPHGDTSASDALATMVTAPSPLFFGKGNWGSLIDPPAAMRYTEVKVSPLGHQLLHPDYMPIVPMMPNYDEREQEPIFLPALLPFILMNPSLGVGTGVSTLIPAFTPTSLLGVTTRLLRGEELTAPRMRKMLEFNEAWGARPVDSPANRKAIEAIMIEGTSTSVQFITQMDVDENKRVVTITGASFRFNPVSFIKKFKQLPGVQRITSSKSIITVVAKRTLAPQAFRALCNQIRKATTTSASYDIYVSKRRPQGEGKYTTEFKRLSVLGLLTEWIEFRTTLEYKSLGWRLGKIEALLHRLRLMVYAAKHLDVVFAALRSADAKAYLVKHLKITADDAQIILDLRVHQLSKLDVQKTNDNIAVAEATQRDLKRRMKDPASTVLEMVEDAAKRIRVIEEGTPNHLLPGFRQWEYVPSKAIKQEDESMET